ncbi:hypothetical protein FRX31_003521 [Thalictrum thalictroides]|uniref:F-box domain-containing protein n=1 Tax=Thalictrum thalictroides TaxID=46969 RepID=A0A7J6XAS6_THATH|nr:hypothetical protein FRX31_003521 [Thalictrum thalictroides]
MKNNSLVEREENKDKEQEGGWSQLPALLIWMIMDLLHIDSFRLAFVCKDWESMSLNYPLPAGSGVQRQCVPWMMHQRQNHIPFHAGTLLICRTRRGSRLRRLTMTELLYYFREEDGCSINYLTHLIKLFYITFTPMLKL